MVFRAARPSAVAITRGIARIRSSMGVPPRPQRVMLPTTKICKQHARNRRRYTCRMSTTTQPEAWMRGPIEGVDPMLMPVAHALVQAREELGELVSIVPAEHVWTRPGGAASIGFHVRHLGAALDRLFTYARDERLSDAQKAALRAEVEPGDPPAG